MNQRFVPQIVLGCALWLMLAGRAGADLTNVHSLSFSVNNQPTEIFLNGFPVFVSAGTNQSTSTLPADPYLVRGTNQFLCLTWQNVTNLPSDEFTAVHLQLTYGPPASLSETDLLTIERLVRVPGTNALLEQIIATNVAGVEIGFSANITAVRTYLTLDGQSGEGHYRPNGPRGTNVIETAMALTNPPLTSLPWQGASPVLAQQDFTNIQQVVQAVHAAFTNHSVALITNLFALKIARLAATRGVTFAQEALTRQQFFSRLFAQNPLTVDPVDPASLSVRAYSAANLVQVTLNGQPPIQLTGPGFRYRLPLYLSKIAGVWQVVE